MSLRPKNSKALYTEDRICVSLSSSLKSKYVNKIELNFSFLGKEIGKVSKRRKGKVGICEVLAFWL